MKALEELRLFEHLSRTRHFGRTAAECHVSPSSLSRTIARLEAELGCRLFDRDQRSVALSPDGVRFGSFAAEVLDAWSRYMAEGEDNHEALTGTVGLFCTVTASQTILPEMLARFRAAHPGVHLALQTGYASEALDRLDDGSVDVTVAAVPPRVPRHLTVHVITTMPLVFVAPQGAGTAVAAALSAGEPGPGFVLPTSGLVRLLVDRWFRRNRIQPVVAAEAAGHEAVLSLVSLGCGVGVVPELVAAQSPLSAGLEVIPLEAPLPSFDIAACTTAERLRARAVAALWSSLTGGA